MNAPHPSRPTAWVATAATLAARLFVGGLYLYMGLSKALAPVGFLKLTRQYDLVQSYWMLNGLAAALPWFEVLCGLLLLAGVAVRGTALVSLLMLLPFTVLVWQRALALQAAAGLAFCAVRFDCGCGMGEVWICRKLLENGLLILASLVLLLWSRPTLCLRHDLAGRRPAPSGCPAH